MADRPVLVIGGCGFLGFHIVRKLLDDGNWTSVHVMSRNPTVNTVAGVHYHRGDITLGDEVTRVISAVQPVAIIHTSSPASTANEASFFTVNVDGTRNVLDAAKASKDTKAFVYTSSASALDAVEYFEIKEEDAPLATESSRHDSYGKSKAIADQMVLDSNDPSCLKTASLRVNGLYGERDKQMVTGALATLKGGNHKMQIGDNTALYDPLSVTNAADAHILALDGLLDSNRSSDIAGEAFHISDGKPLPFWDLMRKIWAAADTEVSPSEITVVPAWLVLPLVSMVEWIYSILSMGRLRPSRIRRGILEYTCVTKTFSIQKARKRLGYTAVTSDRDYQIQKSVDWEQQWEKDKQH